MPPALPRTARDDAHNTPAADSSVELAAAVFLTDATQTDAAAIQAIYAHHVRTGTATFETDPPSTDEIGRRLAIVRDQALPYLVARTESDGALLGYAYAAPFRTRAAYRHTVEDSIYLAPQAAGRGLGTRLLAALIERCQARGDIHQMIAVITNPGSEASVALHRRLGFQMVGTLAEVGHKHGQWLDTIYMQRIIGNIHSP